MTLSNTSNAFVKVIIVLQCLLAQNVLADDWELLISMGGRWKFSIGDDLKWANPDYDDHRWKTITVPAMWENEGFHGYDGFAWYRKIFNGTHLPKEKPIFLFLGYIDDADEVYINGNLVGISGSFPPQFSTAHRASRRYLIPSEVINFEGNNLISVRVFDKYGEGGIVYGDIGLYTTKGVPNMTIGLEGVWSFKTGDDSQWKNRYYNDENWDPITVPSPWENQGFKRYDGFGWYRRTIRFTEAQVKQPLVLLLGKIDDFDQTYFNGNLIGSTNDGRPYGRSGSFSKIRAYDIPPELIRVGQTNTIAIRVLDIGNIGGIYEGPVGILPKSQVIKFLEYYENEW
jgi:sialate O-acetylesterase